MFSEFGIFMISDVGTHFKNISLTESEFARLIAKKWVFQSMLIFFVLYSVFKFCNSVCNIAYERW